MARKFDHALVKRALAFATAAHASIDHRRKYSNQPYIVHPIAVSKIVGTVSKKAENICAALLHDVVEDTPVTLAEIVAEFGNVIGSLVEQLTDVSKPEDGNRTVRKNIDLEHSAKASADGQTIKLADLIDNAISIIANDPDFAPTFMREMRRLLEVLNRGDKTLQQRAWKIVKDWEKAR